VARTCTICSHPKLVNIDRQLLRGDMLNSIAHRFHVSPDAFSPAETFLRRHEAPKTSNCGTIC
jgi:hypothetical protein